MSETRTYNATERELIPRMMIRLLVGLVTLTLILVSAHVWTGQPRSAVPPTDAGILVERVVYLDGAMSGAARVRTEDGTVIADLSPEEGGFISGVWRVLQRERTNARVALDAPVILRAYDNGRTAITDPSTGWSADLMGFGQDNAAAFARLLLNAPAPAQP